MDIDLIRTFIQVAKTNHFRKAAEQLFLTPSAVSARIKQLEERLGTKLLNRNKHDVSLTTAGVRFLGRAEKMMELWSHACQEAMLPEQAESALVIGATDTIWNIFLTDWIVEMNRIHPQQAVWAELHTAASLMPGLLDGSLDVAVMFDLPALPRLAIQELAAIELVLVTSSKGLASKNAIRSDYIAVDWGDSFAASIEQHFGPGIPSRIRTSVGRVALELLLKSGGSAYLPMLMVEEHLRKENLYRIKDAPVIIRPVYAATVTGSERYTDSQAAIEIMKRCLQQRLQHS